MENTINVQEQTYRRLLSTLEEMMKYKKRDISLDDLINELIDLYQENSWVRSAAGAGGG